MTKPKPMKVEPSGWIHDIPLQPAEHHGLMIVVGIGVAAAIMAGIGHEPNYGASLVILGILVVALMVGSFLFSAVKPKVNICPECNIRTTYNPEQKFCGRCGYRPERT